MSFGELKQRQSVMWGSAPFERIADIGGQPYDDIVDRLDPRPGERWLDVACGTQPPLPEGAGSPLAWGSEGHVQRLLGDAFELEFAEGDAFLEAQSGEEVWQLFSTSFGPTKTLYESLEGERRKELDRAVVDVHESFRSNGGIRMERLYLVTTGRRR